MATPGGATVAARFGDNLRHARKDAGLSQEEAGIRASLHRTEIGLLERGERIPRIDTAIKLAGAVGAPVSELVAGIEWSPGFARAGQFEAVSGGGGGGEDGDA
jgi:transcriptional regulator with XRE-family HTH domain